MVLPSAAISTNLTTWSTVSKRYGTPMCPRTRPPIASACSVLPVSDDDRGDERTSIVRLAAKLAAQTAGHSRPPPSSSAASAMPDGGQTAVA